MPYLTYLLTGYQTIDTQMAESDVSDEFERTLLKRLDEYGQSLMDEEDYEKRKRKVRKKRKLSDTKVETMTELSTAASECLTKMKKKKKTEIVVSQAETIQANSGLSKAERKIAQLKKELGITEEHLETSGQMSCEGFIRQDKLLNKSNANPETLGLQTEVTRAIDAAVPVVEMGLRQSPEVVVYENPAKRKMKRDLTTLSNSQSVFSMKNARYDVRKLGIDAMSKVKKEEAMISLLCSLGAKAPKKKFFNYKVYQAMRKKEMEELKEKQYVDRRLGIDTKLPKKKRKRTRDKNDVGSIDGQAGTYKKGVQIVKELKGFNKRH